VIGGYFSDRCGAKVVMISAMVGWSALTLITPLMTQACCDSSRRGILHMFVILRVLTGCVQGRKSFCLKLGYFSFKLWVYWLAKLVYTVSQKKHPRQLSAVAWPILIIFDENISEVYWLEEIVLFPTSPNSCSYTTLGNQKV